MTYELLAKKEYKRRGEVIESDIDFCVKRVCSMTPNQALAIIRATRYTPGRSAVVNKCDHASALDAYEIVVTDYIERGIFGRPADPDKPFKEGKWDLVRNICVDCLGITGWFNREGEDG